MADVKVEEKKTGTCSVKDRVLDFLSFGELSKEEKQALFQREAVSLEMRRDPQSHPTLAAELQKLYNKSSYELDAKSSALLTTPERAVFRFEQFVISHGATPELIKSGDGPRKAMLERYKAGCI